MASSNPDDPVTNTATEYMYQMATIAHHTLTGTQTVILADTREWDGDGDGTVSPDATTYTGGEWDPATSGEDAIFMPGTYTVPVARPLLDRLQPPAPARRTCA